MWRCLSLIIHVGNAMINRVSVPPLGILHGVKHSDQLPAKPIPPHWRNLTPQRELARSPLHIEDHCDLLLRLPDGLVASFQKNPRSHRPWRQPFSRTHRTSVGNGEKPRIFAAEVCWWDREARMPCDSVIDCFESRTPGQTKNTRGSVTLIRLVGY